MRPLLLTIRAFGPYAGSQTLDFGELGRHGFFLIHGPTGAGKTTVLDAMCYALYGDTSGGERDAAAMRSHHSEPGVPTEVRFDFAVGERRFRVERAPEQERPKQRGEGTTVDKPRAALWDRTAAGTGDEGVPLATKPTDVTARVEEILGFRSVQFRQVVMLPQGQFQTLLHTSSSKREEILERLFRTERYARIEDKLKAEAAAVEDRLRDLTRRRESILDEAGVASPDELDVRVDELQRALAAADQRVASAEGVERETRKTLDAAAAVADAIEACDKASQHLDELRQRAAEVDEWRERLGAARRAAALADVAERRASRSADLERLREAAVKATSALAAATSVQAVAAERLNGERAREAEREDLAARVRELGAIGDKVDAVAVAASEHRVVGEQLESARADAASARHGFETAVADMARIETAWTAGRAALLAESLREGDECPVCGSREHPHPAVASFETPSDDDLESARRHVERARDAYDAKKDSVAGLQAQDAALAERVARLRDGLGEHAALSESEPEAVQAVLDEARTRSDAARRAFEEAEAQERLASDQLTGATTAAELAASDAATAGRSADVAEREFLRRLAAAEFASQSDYRAALLSSGDLASAERLVADYDAALAAAQATHAQAEIAAAGLQPPDTDSLRADHDAANRVANEARAARAAIAAEAAAAAKAALRLGELERDAGKSGVRFEVIGRLSKVANGQLPDNPLRLSFQRYMLGAYLDDVLIVASQRLHVMTEGRYTLRRVLQGDKRRSLGLDLEVLDAYTGSARPVSTLSGGETFQASLALALGLADVVQAYEGGIRLDTVFVDEGFGSLDPDNLDAAIAALMGLQTGGRLVGIISHVGDLRDQVAARLEIEPGLLGSTARFVVP